MLYNLLQLSDDWLDRIGLYSLLQVLYQLEFRAFAAVVLSFALVLLFGKRTIAWLIRQKIGDAPEFYRADVNELMASKAATPTMGGILICGSILVTTLLLADLSARYVHLALVVLVWLAVVGGIDDWLKLTGARRHPGSREGLYAWEKLLFQLGLGAVVGVFVYRHLQLENNDAAPALTLPFQRTYDPKTGELAQGLIILSGGAFVIISMLVIAGCSNAVNLTDGMDGLAAGTMVVASFAFMVLCYIAGREQAAQTLLFPYIGGAKELMVVTGAMAGACLGFLWFNCARPRSSWATPARCRWADCSRTWRWPSARRSCCSSIGGVFLMEMLSVILQVGYYKWTKGRRIFRCSPIHHHFHLAGWSEQQVVTRFWLLAVVFAMLALVSIKLR